jgi:peptidoglycan/LPS O-acetylase OafA/YrhL
MLEFLIGASVYAALPTILRHADYYGPRAALFLAGLLFLAMAAIELYAPVDFGYSGSRWFFFGIPAGLLLICMRVAEPVLRRAGASLQVLCFLGDASYATYLSHIYVIQFVSKLVPSSDWIGRMHLRGPLMILLATGIGALLYMFVDRPVLKYVRKVVNPIYRRESREEGFAVPLGSQV